MEQAIAIVDSKVESVEEQQIVEVPLDDLDRVAGGIIGLFF